MKIHEGGHRMCEGGVVISTGTVNLVENGYFIIFGS